MAAVISLRTAPALDESNAPSAADGSSGRPRLTVIHGGRSPVSLRRRRTFMVRRALVLTVLIAAVWLVAQLFGAVMSWQGSTAPAPVSSPAAVHRVAPGDTLWALATSVDPAADPRDVVDQIVQMNAVGTPDAPLGPDLQLRVGADQRLPVSS
jgi:hypothetical protein